jgi:hypothetical protein
MDAIIFTTFATMSRLYLNTFEGLTFKYWGDFEFFVFLTIVNMLYLKLETVSLVKYYVIAFLLRFVVRSFSPTKIEDVPEEKRPKDVVFTFKRCTQCSNLYDVTQLVSFIALAFVLVQYRKQVVKVLSQ